MKICDSASCSRLIDGLCRAGDASTATRLLEKMEVKDIVFLPPENYRRVPTTSTRQLEKNMKTLNDTLQDLNSKRSDLEHQVEVELSLFKIQKEEVKIWEKRVDVMNNEVKKIEEKVRKHNYLSRARLGKHVEEKILEVKELLQRAVSFSTLVIDRPPAKGVILPTQQLVGQTSVVGNIFAQLIGDEAGNAGIIGVCGVKGIGKTIIAKHVNNKLVREIATRGNKFGKVIWVTGTHKGDEFNFVKFQNDVAADLLGDKYDNNQKLLPDPEERDRRAGKVTQMLEASKGSVVIILDDVQKPFSLSDAGVSEPIARGKCKLLITSRSEELCRSMGCQVVETVTPLPKNDALTLFSQRSGLEHLMAVPVVARIIIEVVEECGGMPTQILSLASEMKGVNDVHEWRRKRMERKSEAFEGDGGKGEAALRAFMRRYDKDGDGRLSKLELKEAFKEMGSNNPAWKAVRALRHADTNRDGFIDGKELRQFIGYVNRSFSMDIN